MRPFLLLLALILPASVMAQQSTTGPIPPPGTDRGLTSPSRSQVTISGVPAYIWHHGCGPTAMGMVIGYWDGHGYPDLVPGDPGTQTVAVDAMIADDSESPNCSLPDGDHYQDYSCPLDYAPSPLAPDRSQTGGAHTSDCVGDFMKTSWSSVGNYYGWSWNNNIPTSFVSYVNFISTYIPSAQTYSFSQFSWSLFKGEVDVGRPMVLLVDSDGDGSTDHFVTAIGYDEATSQYGVHDTWDSSTHWYQWHAMQSGAPWGIYAVTTCSLKVVCCTDGLCSLVPMDVCLSGGGEWISDVTSCTPNPCPGPPVGACCFRDGSCELLRESICVGNGGTFYAGAPCSSFMCNQPPQACCFHDNSCQILHPMQCLAQGGNPLGVEWQSCDPPPCPTSDVAEAAAELPGTLVSPNPVVSDCRISYWVDPPGRVAIEIVNAEGRVVRHLVQAFRERGSHVETWDGQDDNGTRVPSGVYFLRVFGTHLKGSVRIILID